ncbi:MAG TPA: DUF6194 family protein [Aldersonia sp.]
MSPEDVITFVSGFPGVVAQTPGPGDGSPEIAWGDTFFFYDPDDRESARRMPFATIVVKNYPGFDEFSDLDREGVFRVNVGVGRERVPDVAEFDYAAFDVLLPHPTYAKQGWVSIVNPGAATESVLRSFLIEAYERAKARHR